jgi:hypothetical protein
MRLFIFCFELLPETEPAHCSLAGLESLPSDERLLGTDTAAPKILLESIGCESIGSFLSTHTA